MTNPYLQLAILISIGGYFLGSILFSKILPQAVRGIDIEAVSEDGNPGVSNVFKYCGVPIGIFSALCDFGKAFAPIFIGYQLIPPEFRTALTFGMIICSAVLGHIFSIFHHFNGGMGVGPMFGALMTVFLECQLIFFLIGIYIVIRWVIRVKQQHLRTFLCFSIFLVCVAIFGRNMVYKPAFIILCAVICLKCTYVAVRQRNAAKAES